MFVQVMELVQQQIPATVIQDILEFDVGAWQQLDRISEFNLVRNALTVC